MKEGEKGEFLKIQVQNIFWQFYAVGSKVKF